MRVYGYVVMPEHVHLLVSEPERMSLASAIQLLKQNVSRLSHPSKISQGGAPTHSSKTSQGGAPQPFWLPRYFDLNVWTEKKLIEKLRYMHRNPVKRGLVERPEDWGWSSFRHYMLGEVGPVEIESQWTARKRWMSGLENPTLKKPK
jgi:putative transposase